MKDNTMKIAKMFGWEEGIKNLETDLTDIEGITSVEFDLHNLLDDIPQVIFLPHYEIKFDQDFFVKRRTMLSKIIDTAKKHGLLLSGDRIEDYGDAMYFVTEMKTPGFSNTRKLFFRQFKKEMLA